MAPDHGKRIVTGLALATCLIAAIVAGGWIVRLLVLIASSVALWELLTMCRSTREHLGAKLVSLAVGAVIVLSQALGPLWTAAAMAVFCCAVSLAFLFDYGRGNTEARFEQYVLAIHGLLYIPFVLQLALYLAPSEQFLVMLAAVATDMGGYYGGKYFGRRKLWPAVSPGKTWAGCAGGIVLCVLVCTLHGYAGYRLGWSLPAFPLWGWACLGLLLCLAAQLGDFFESALKRSLDVKDSGSILPGHGGMLDRIDSLLFVLPVYTLVALSVS
jgi:phosphatidate cytidylyltransferase